MKRSRKSMIHICSVCGSGTKTRGLHCLPAEGKVGPVTPNRLIPQMRTEDGKEIIFIREDGSLSEGPVMQRGSDPTSGEVVFYELQGHLKPSVNGKDTYERVCIQRVFPAVRAEEDAREAA